MVNRLQSIINTTKYTITTQPPYTVLTPTQNTYTTGTKIDTKVMKAAGIGGQYPLHADSAIA